MPDQLHEIDIAAPAAKVYDAIVTEDGLKAWWTDDSTAEPAVGSVARFGFYGGAVYFDMKVTELESPSKVRWQCVGGPPEWMGTTVTWDLGPGDNGAARVRFAHKGWPSTDGAFAKANTTWGTLMQKLKDHVEGKNPGPFFASM